MLAWPLEVQYLQPVKPNPDVAGSSAQGSGAGKPSAQTVETRSTCNGWSLVFRKEGSRSRGAMGASARIRDRPAPWFGDWPRSCSSWCHSPLEELVATLLPLLMGLHTIIAVVLAWLWYRWQPGGVAAIFRAVCPSFRDACILFGGSPDPAAMAVEGEWRKSP